ncbi:alpha-L-arabinofuranosidase C-terminal domain-containing protein [Sphingomonas sp. MMS24-JH45]
MGRLVRRRDAPALYLESTTRDAVIAGLSLNIFNRHADRVRMANLAQMVNVIQSLVLTRGKDMVVTRPGTSSTSTRRIRARR